MLEGPERRPVTGPLHPHEAVDVADGPGSFVVPGDHNRRLKELGTSAWLWVLAAVMASPEPHQYGLALVTLPIVAVIALHFGRRALDASPRLAVDAEGITDRTALFGGTLHLKWDEIRAVAPARWRDAVDLEIVDMDAVRARLGLGRRIEIALNRFFGVKHLSIAVTLLGTTKGALAARIEEGLLAAERASLGLQPPTPALPKPDERLSGSTENKGGS